MRNAIAVFALGVAAAFAVAIGVALVLDLAKQTTPPKQVEKYVPVEPSYNDVYRINRSHSGQE